MFYAALDVATVGGGLVLSIRTVKSGWRLPCRQRFRTWFAVFEASESRSFDFRRIEDDGHTYGGRLQHAI